MEPTLVTFTELSQQLNTSIHVLRRAYQRGDIPGIRLLSRVIRFDVEKVKRAWETRGQKATEAQQPDKYASFRARIQAALDGRTAVGASRRRAHPKAPGQVKRGRLSQECNEGRSGE